MSDKLNGRAAPTDDTRGLVRSELRSVEASVRRALVKTKRSGDARHLEDVRDQIAKILDPEVRAAGGAGGGGGNQGQPLADEEFDSCWPDYAIRLSGDSQS